MTWIPDEGFAENFEQEQDEGDAGAGDAGTRGREREKERKLSQIAAAFSDSLFILWISERHVRLKSKEEERYSRRQEARLTGSPFGPSIPIAPCVSDDRRSTRRQPDVRHMLDPFFTHREACVADKERRQESEICADLSMEFRLQGIEFVARKETP